MNLTLLLDQDLQVKISLDERPLENGRRMTKISSNLVVGRDGDVGRSVDEAI